MSRTAIFTNALSSNMSATIVRMNYFAWSLSANMHPYAKFRWFGGSLSSLRSHLAAAMLVSVALTCTNAFAFGTDGHQTVALIEQAQLTPKARAEVDRLLALEPGATLASISTWADENRNPATAAWHYVNFPRTSCEYQEARDCPNGKCVVAAIEEQTKILASSATDDARLTALKYIVHLVGDVHQPLHAGYQDDKGGNTHQLQAFGRGTNLHSVWDSGLIRNLNEPPATLAKRLLNQPVPVGSVQVDPRIAAQESCAIVKMADFYPDRQLRPEYVAKFTAIAEQRITLAGYRLATILNQAIR